MGIKPDHVWLQAPTPGPWVGSYVDDDFKFSLGENFLTEQSKPSPTLPHRSG